MSEHTTPTNLCLDPIASRASYSPALESHLAVTHPPRCPHPTSRARTPFARRTLRPRASPYRISSRATSPRQVGVESSARDDDDDDSPRETPSTARPTDRPTDRTAPTDGLDGRARGRFDSIRFDSVRSGRSIDRSIVDCRSARDRPREDERIDVAVGRRDMTSTRRRRQSARGGGTVDVNGMTFAREDADR